MIWTPRLWTPETERARRRRMMQRRGMLALPCCCGPACTRWDDQFDRADSTTLGNGWIEQTGDAAIVSQTVRFTTANALATKTVPIEGSIPTSDFFVSECRVRASADGDKARLYFWGDATHYVVVELTFGTSARIKVSRDDGAGVDLIKDCAATLAVNTYYTVLLTPGGITLGGSSDTRAWSVYLDGTAFSVNGISSGNVNEPAGADNSVGIGTGGTVTGNVDFDWAKASYADWQTTTAAGDCPDFPRYCWPWSVEGPIEEFTAEVQGSSCGDPTYVMPVDSGCAAFPCVFFGCWSSGGADGDELRICESSEVNCRIRFVAKGDIWQKILTSTDCALTATDITLPHLSGATCGGGSTVKITVS